jgi:ubiquinone/menaquinone biosynthesis C-methylase UbiE
MSDSKPMFNDGAAYERRMGRFSRLVGEVFLDWLAAPKGLRWIDVGCGNGAFTEVLIARCAPAAVDGIDPSEGQLSFARKREGAKLAKFHQGEAQALPFADDSFDAASMALVISFVPEPEKAAREMARVVKAGGIVATYMWDLPGGGIPVKPMHDALKYIGHPVAAPGADVTRRENLQALWRTAGLREVESRTVRIRVTYSDFDEFWQANSIPDGLTGKILAAMSPQESERLRARLREQLPIAADGSISYEAFANAVKGRAPQ